MCSVGAELCPTLINVDQRINSGSPANDIEELNLPVIIAYAIFFAATFMSIFAYKAVPLSMGAILEATGYIYVTVFGVTIFGERISARKVLALVLIIGGIAVYSFLG